ncbi:MAG: cyclic nucleotide-binding domain-containing protein [Gaiellaceae bacterium]|jgi:CRP/FNR family transcriptional regulator, cyclic AMP receptor protein
MTLAARVERLRTVSLFARLDDDSLALVASVAREFEAPAGRVLAEPKQTGTGMFVIDEGEARAEMRGGSARGLHGGDCFGELALLVPDGARTARVSAVTDVRCLAITRDDFHHLLEREPRIAISLLEVLAERLAG